MIKYTSHRCIQLMFCQAETFKTQIISLILLDNILLVLYFINCYFQFNRVTLITDHLKKNDGRKHSKTWVSEAPRHVPI